MNAHAVQVTPPPGHGDHAVQQATALIAMVGNVLVLEREETEARQDGVAVVAVVVDRVAAVDVLPAVSGEERVLRLDGRAGETQREALVEPLHFLEEDDVGVEGLEPLAQVVDHHAPVEVRQALMDVERDDLEAFLLHGSPSTTIASRFDQEKHFAAASRHGSHARAVCSSRASVTRGRASSSSANTCSTLWITPGAKR